jgi:hypothetical protein
MKFDEICDRFDNGKDTQQDVQYLINYITQLQEAVSQLEEDNIFLKQEIIKYTNIEQLSLFTGKEALYEQE